MLKVLVILLLMVLARIVHPFFSWAGSAAGLFIFPSLSNFLSTPNSSHSTCEPTFTTSPTPISENCTTVALKRPSRIWRELVCCTGDSTATTLSIVWISWPPSANTRTATRQASLWEEEGLRRSWPKLLSDCGISRSHGWSVREQGQDVLWRVRKTMQRSFLQ